MKTSIKNKLCRIQYFPVSFFSVILGLGGFTIASILMYHMTGYRFFFFVALCFSICLTILILLFTILTIRAVLRKEICVEESS
jgi:tellurite resistance protein TehA-like permease